MQAGRFDQTGPAPLPPRFPRLQGWQGWQSICEECHFGLEGPLEVSTRDQPCRVSRRVAESRAPGRDCPPRESTVGCALRLATPLPAGPSLVTSRPAASRRPPRVFAGSVRVPAGAAAQQQLSRQDRGAKNRNRLPEKKSTDTHKTMTAAIHLATSVRNNRVESLRIAARARNHEHKPAEAQEGGARLFCCGSGNADNSAFKAPSSNSNSG